MTPPRRLIAIVNPSSGPRRASSGHAAVVLALRALGPDVQIHTTNGRGHATQIAKDLDIDEGDAVIAVGGDGTLHEVVNGLFSRGDQAMPTVGVIAAGTGNATCLDLGMIDPDVAITAIRSGDTRAIDVATVVVDGRTLHAINVVGWGAFARINARAERLRWMGGARYTVAALCEIISLRIRGAESALDGVRQDPFLLGAACLTRHSARGMMIAPHAVMDDGYADLVLIRKGPRLVLAALLKSVFRGGHVGSPRVEYRKRDALYLELDPGSSVVVDGELLPARVVTIEIRCRALQVYAPPHR